MNSNGEELDRVLRESGLDDTPRNRNLFGFILRNRLCEIHRDTKALVLTERGLALLFGLEKLLQAERRRKERGGSPRHADE